MIGIQDARLLDILPYTFKKDGNVALSEAVSALTAFFYVRMSNVIFWADIQHAHASLLDAMAAELDAPFYRADLDDDTKRSLIAAAFVYNSRIGTKSSVERLLKAAFGSGAVEEWYEYGGKEYYFKIRLYWSLTKTDIENFAYFAKTLNKVKNKRSKLEELVIEFPSSPFREYVLGLAGNAEFERVNAAYAKDGEDETRAGNVKTLGAASMAEYMKIPTGTRTFGEIAKMTWENVRNTSLDEVLQN